MSVFCLCFVILNVCGSSTRVFIIEVRGSNPFLRHFLIKFMCHNVLTQRRKTVKGERRRKEDVSVKGKDTPECKE